MAKPLVGNWKSKIAAKNRAPVPALRRFMACEIRAFPCVVFPGCDSAFSDPDCQAATLAIGGWRRSARQGTSRPRAAPHFFPPACDLVSARMARFGAKG